MDQDNVTHEFKIMEILGNIREDVAATKTAVEGLAGPMGRVTMLEQDAKTASNRQWIHTAIILPIVTIGHLTAKHFGF
jgi:hypothetical protein